MAPDESLIKGGYERLAEGMGACTSFTIFRRFTTLSLENLLYLQADLFRLETQLRTIQHQDKHSGHVDRSLYYSDWDRVIESGNYFSVSGNNSRQLETILEIRIRLKEYRQ